jgi:hypothetical protein
MSELDFNGLCPFVQEMTIIGLLAAPWLQSITNMFMMIDCQQFRGLNDHQQLKKLVFGKTHSQPTSSHPLTDLNLKGIALSSYPFIFVKFPPRLHSA